MSKNEEILLPGSVTIGTRNRAVSLYNSNRMSYQSALGLFNSFLQILLADRNPQTSTFHPLSVLFLIPDVDHLLYYLRRHSLSLLCEQHAGLTKSLSMPADDTGMLKIIFAQIFSLPSLLNFQKPVGCLIQGSDTRVCTQKNPVGFLGTPT